MYSTSTPRPESKARVHFDITKGRSDVTDGDGDTSVQGDAGLNLDKFVTKRKHQGKVDDLGTASGGSRDRPSDGKRLGTMMKRATYAGSGPWLDYKAHFEACAKLNGWSDEQKGLYLSVSLRGQAQGVFGNLRVKYHELQGAVASLGRQVCPS